MGKQNKKSPIKPCPFCGHIPYIDTRYRRYFPPDEEEHRDYVTIHQRVLIKCPTCCLVKDIICENYAPDGLDVKEYRRIQKTSAQLCINKYWNERVNNGVL